jgi:enterochelin esterase-like enzyme
LEQPGIPKGEIRGPFTLPSAAYPGTQHTYWIYVPAQYNAAKEASLMIFNDGQAFLAPTGNLRAFNVLDNLIYRREIPVMVAVFINPDAVRINPNRRRRIGATATRIVRRNTTRSMIAMRGSSSMSFFRNL